MVIFKSCTPDSDQFNIGLSGDEFLHLYGVLFTLLHFDDSDKMLVKLERRMFDIL